MARQDHHIIVRDHRLGLESDLLEDAHGWVEWANTWLRSVAERNIQYPRVDSVVDLSVIKAVRGFRNKARDVLRRVHLVLDRGMPRSKELVEGLLMNQIFGPSERIHRMATGSMNEMNRRYPKKHHAGMTSADARLNPVRKEGSKWAVCKPDGSIDLLLGDEQAARRLAVACGYDAAPAAPTRRKPAAPKKKRTAAPAPSKHAQEFHGLMADIKDDMTFLNRALAPSYPARSTLHPEDLRKYKRRFKREAPMIVESITMLDKVVRPNQSHIMAANDVAMQTMSLRMGVKSAQAAAKAGKSEAQQRAQFGFGAGMTPADARRNPFIVGPSAEYFGMEPGSYTGPAYEVTDQQLMGLAHRRAKLPSKMRRALDEERFTGRPPRLPAGYELRQYRRGRVNIFYMGEDTGKYATTPQKAMEIISRMVDGQVVGRRMRRNPAMLSPDLKKVALTYLQTATRALKAGDEAGASYAAGKAARLLLHYTGSDDKPSGF